MKIKRNIKVKIETFEATVVQFGKSRNYHFCVECQNITIHFSSQQIMQILDINYNQLNFWVDNRQIHFKESENGLMFCSNSLKTQLLKIAD
jgi:hypothetical protein